jgi:hypothetical protein
VGDITIRFRMNVVTGKKDIVIEYEGDDDALPHEHERRHKQIVEQLVGQGLLEPGEAGEVQVERIKPPPKKAKDTTQRPAGEAEAARG